MRTREVRDDRHVVFSVDHDVQHGYLLGAAGIGAALVRHDGLEVICAPDPDSPDWPALLVGQVLPLVATIRGLEVFHAAGVVLGDRSYMLCAAQGVGKTSLALHLVASGAQLLSDDVVALGDDLVAHAGIPVLNVRPAELARLDPAGMPGLRRLGTVRGRATFATDRPAAARQLGGIYVLERAVDGEAIEAEEAPSPFLLLGATFNVSVRTEARLAHHLELCARLATQVPVFRVRVVPGRDAALLASLLLRHMQHHAPR
jgi:hypothetical protein